MDLLRKQLEANIKKFERKLWTQSEVQLLLELREIGLGWEEISKKISGTNPQVCKRKFHRQIAENEKWPKELDDRVKYLLEVQSKSWEEIYVILNEEFGLIQRKKLRDIRERYRLCLSSAISREPWTAEEDLKLLQCMKKSGRKWKKISKKFNCRN